MASRLGEWFRPLLLALGAVLALGASAPASAAPRGEFSREDEAIIQEKWPEAVQLPSGLRYIVTREGKGPKPQTRQHLKALYRGMLLDGTQFDAKLDPAQPFTFALGAGQVIVGWEEAFADMRAGEKRTLILPYALAYGLRGRQPDIPNRATLVFEVELLSIE